MTCRGWQHVMVSGHVVSANGHYMGLLFFFSDIFSAQLRNHHVCVCVCVQNGFWFSVGWCLAFTVPAIIVALSLTSLYRASTDYPDTKSFDQAWVTPHRHLLTYLHIFCYLLPLVYHNDLLYCFESILSVMSVSMLVSLAVCFVTVEACISVCYVLLCMTTLCSVWIIYVSLSVQRCFWLVRWVVLCKSTAEYVVQLFHCILLLVASGVSVCREERLTQSLSAKAQDVNDLNDSLLCQ